MPMFGELIATTAALSQWQAGSLQQLQRFIMDLPVRAQEISGVDRPFALDVRRAATSFLQR
jgi:hypothetical protein